MGRKVLIFGATGEIGGRIAQLAVQAGHTVYGAVRGKYKNDLIDLTGVTMLSGDKRDETFLHDVCAPLKPDVVIDTVQRGNGFGRKLIEHAIGYCKEAGLGTVYLTSNPKRVAANTLYQSVGFTRKETNMYKMDLKK